MPTIELYSKRIYFGEFDYYSLLYFIVLVQFTIVSLSFNFVDVTCKVLGVFPANSKSADKFCQILKWQFIELGDWINNQMFHENSLPTNSSKFEV